MLGLDRVPRDRRLLAERGRRQLDAFDVVVLVVREDVFQRGKLGDDRRKLCGRRSLLPFRRLGRRLRCRFRGFLFSLWWSLFLEEGDVGVGCRSGFYKTLDNS